MAGCRKVFILKRGQRNTDLLDYTHVRVYHACRPINIKKYMAEGIHGFSKEQVYQIVYDTFSKIGVNENKILETFNKRWEESLHHYNKICVNISKKELLNESGHYLVYGSEFICGMAAELFCQRELKSIGVPTIFVCDVDICKIPSEVLEWIKDDWLGKGAWDGGIFLRNEIEPSEIVDYINPKEMFDPLTWSKYKLYG